MAVTFRLLLLAAGLHVAWRNWAEDPSQRSLRSVCVFVMRVVAGGMRFQGHDLEVAAPRLGRVQRPAWPPAWPGGQVQRGHLQGTIVRDALVPHVALLQPLVYLLEIMSTISLALGFAVRLSGLVAVLFTLQLWPGLYNDPTEWPGTYLAIVSAHGIFAICEAGRFLGRDDLLRQRDAVIVRGKGLLAAGYRLAS